MIVMYISSKLLINGVVRYILYYQVQYLWRLKSIILLSYAFSVKEYMEKPSLHRLGNDCAEIFHVILNLQTLRLPDVTGLFFFARKWSKLISKDLANT